MESNAWYTVHNASEIDSPALIIYADRVKRNIALLKTFVSDVRQLRPHVKTNKCPEVVRMMLDAGITKFKCATIAEAEMLLDQGARDVLLAYQPVGPKAERFCQLQHKFSASKLSCLLDNENSLAELSSLAKKHQVAIKVCIDLNVGMNRTGIVPGKPAFDLFRKAKETAGIDILGLHAYDGHLRDADLELRTKKCDEAFLPVAELQKKIQSVTGNAPVIIAGGTPTFPIHARNSEIECSPGTFVFWDKGYGQILSEQPFEFAALVMTRIISKPNDETVCTDLGHKSIASENALGNRVYFLNARDIDAIGHSEEHMVFKTKGNNSYQVGDVLYGVPQHICPTVALHDYASVCIEGRVSSQWSIVGRQRKISI
jgi:D-serine deaminase-like pyridoxal phosphate-dependent protein